MSDAVLVLVTAPSREVGEALASIWVEERLAACVSLLPSVLSIYRWQGKVERADEVLLLVKTHPGRYAALEARIRESHPYDCPEILRFDADGGLPAYLAWLAAQTTSF